MATTLDIAPADDPLALRMPAPCRCGIAFTFDTDMCSGYSPPHPYSFYLHDPQSRFLQEMLVHIRAKPEPVWIGTLRDAIREIIDHRPERGDAETRR